MEAVTQAPTWQEMTVDQKSAFLQFMARCLERLGDLAGAQTAKVWAVSVLEKETGVRPNSQVELPAMTPHQMQQRIYEVVDWIGEAGGGRYLSARLLRDGCFNLARALERERLKQREGRDR